MIDQYASLSEKFLKKGSWLYLFSFIIAPMGYVIKIIISWELTVSEVWILYGIISLITLISAYNDLWISESLKYFIPEFIAQGRYDKVKSILFYALFIQIITSIFITLFFYFWADYIASNYFKTNTGTEALKIFAFYFIGINILQTVNAFFMAVQDTFTYKAVDMVRVIFLMLFVLFIFFWDSSSLINYSYSWLIWLYIWILFSLTMLYKKYYTRYFKWEKIIIEKQLIKQIIKYALLVFIWASAWTILGQMDIQMIIYLLWTTDAWYYTNYLSIIWIPYILIWPIFWFLFPVFSELHSKKEYSKIKLIKQIFSENFLLIWVMFNVFFFIFAEIIAYTLFWEKFITSWIILKYSILLLVFSFLIQINFNILAWIWKVKHRVKIVLIAIIFNFITNLILIKAIWIYWVALATWMGWFLMYILSEYFLGKKYRINYKYSLLIKNIIIVWVMWYLIHFFWLNTFVWISRINSFFLLSLFFIIWLWIFIIINYNQFYIFILEIKKIKK